MLANLGSVLSLARTFVLDGWENSTTGLGTSAADKTTAGRFVRQAPFSAQYLSDLFNGDALAARMCEHENKEMLRKGFEITAGDDDQAQPATDVLTVLRELGAAGALQQALTWEDVFGGGVLLLEIDDGELDPSLPLNEANIRSLRSVKPLEGSRLWARSWYPATHPKAGHVEVWGIMPIGGQSTIGRGPIEPRGRYDGMASVHESRMLVFPGGLVTIDERLRNNGWGRSTLAAVHDPLMDFNMSWRGATHMLQSANQDVWYFSGLKNALADSTGAMLEYFRGRFQLSQMKMGPNRGITLDADGGEKFERHGSQFTGVPDTLEAQAMRLAAARGWPVTILLGRSPAGMNATGESDMAAWYNLVAADRAQRLEPQLRRLITLLMLAKEGPTSGRVLEGWALKWPAFDQLTDLEQADLELKVAQRDQIYLTNQCIRPEEVAVSRWRPEGFSAATVIDLDARQAALEADKQAPDEEPREPAPSDTSPAAAPSTGTEPVATDVQKTALNGAQVASLIEVLTAVVDGRLPRASGIEVIVTAFQVSHEDAERMMGDIGKTFEPKPAEPSGPVPPQLQGFTGGKQPSAPADDDETGNDAE